MVRLHQRSGKNIQRWFYKQLPPPASVNQREREKKREEEKNCYKTNEMWVTTANTAAGPARYGGQAEYTVNKFRQALEEWNKSLHCNQIMRRDYDSFKEHAVINSKRQEEAGKID